MNEVRRSALITGGTGGLGVAVVEAFLEAGWRVVVPWVKEHELERLPSRDGLVLIEADLFDPGSVAGVVAEATADGDAPLQGVANLVGGFAQGGRVHETPIDDFERQLRLNLRGTYLVTQAALRPFPGAAGYVTSKAAVLAFVTAVAVEYRDDGVRCNAVLPSVIDTPANRQAQPDADHERWVRPQEIAGVIRFLCSEESAPVSGAAIPVYGRA